MWVAVTKSRRDREGRMFHLLVLLLLTSSAISFSFSCLSVSFLIFSRTYLLYSNLACDTISWSNGCILEVIFGRRNTTSTAG